MPFLIAVLIIAVLLIAVAALMWRNAPPNKINKLEVPTTEVGTPIGVLYGTKIIKAPILVEYGDVEIILRDPQSTGKK